MVAETGPASAACHPGPAREGDARRGLPMALVGRPMAPRRERDHRALADLRQAATTLAQFVAALQRIDTTGGPRPGAHNFGRGVPLAIRDADTRAAIAKLDNVLDTEAVTAAWDGASNAPAWDGPPVWIHGDLHAGNLLVDHGHLSAVIDFGGLAVGDPACDFVAAWTLFSTKAKAGTHSARRYLSMTPVGREVAAGRSRPA